MPASTTPVYYAILIEGRLDPCWSDWFGGLTITPADTDRDDTVLFGPVADQAALHGILNQISSLGLTLIAVQLGGYPEVPPGAKSPGSPNSIETGITRPEA